MVRKRNINLLENGGSMKVSHIKDFIDESYNKNSKEDLHGYALDKSLSNDYAKTYYNPETKHAIVVHRGTAGFLDWVNNIAYVFGKYYLTRRNWTGKKIQQAAEKKYGSQNVSTLGHSQGAMLASKHGKNSKEVISVNPAYMGEKQGDNEYRVRTSLDPVSGLLAPVNKMKNFVSGLLGKKEKHTKKNITIDSTSYNPLTEHSYQALDRLDPDQMIGKEEGGNIGHAVSEIFKSMNPLYSFKKAAHLAARHVYNKLTGKGIIPKFKNYKEGFLGIINSPIGQSAKNIFHEHITKHIDKKFPDEYKPIGHHLHHLVKEKLKSHSGAGFFDDLKGGDAALEGLKRNLEMLQNIPTKDAPYGKDIYGNPKNSMG